LEADPRFKDDEKFILEQVAPAMLNKLLERLPLLLSEGIDYKATKDAMQKAQEESRHLWQFAREVGLEVQSGGRVWVKDLWQQLQDWYENTGILEIEVNDKGKENTDDAVGDAKTLTQSGGDDGDAISSPFAEICNLLSQLTDDERQKLADLLTQSQPLPKKVTPEDAQTMRDIARVWWLEYYPERIQALVTQMYGWQAPGTKYDVRVLVEWLQGEDDLIRDRITELMHRRRG
jgi:hypothetical protein